MKRELIIEWKRTGGEAGSALPAVLAEIRMLLEMEGVSVRVVETVLPPGSAAALLFNGVPVEDLLEGVEVIPPSCGSCDSCDAGAECRAIRYNGEDYDMIPPDLIGRAAVKALEME
ncbi:MAG: DUF2703 domain-containing protein [Methanomicrobiales archaeon]|nr:DUF2703 domain-containing protein [Methanomicrobiales archaeon]